MSGKQQQQQKGASYGMVRLLSVVGTAASLYALYVESMAKAGAGFTAACDINSWISCSKVFTSPSGHIFWGYPNALFGLMFYLACILYTILTFIPARKYMFFAATTFSFFFSIYLAYILHGMGDLCIVCVSMYVVNTLMFYCGVREFKSIGASAKGNKSN
eukprot:TRINITY_DN66383_c10_g1_i1.p2 TRINITY_DN66383_c10_g1~~TRINITY_DN66383_c10_g1_i1.p2  ORF type:complete len:160 (+),score=75.72 TRINITY_DN66383_c10_g1_i1:44-523(+)